MIEIRLGSAEDADAIAHVRRESWFAAYEGIIAAPVIDRATAPGAVPLAPPPYRRTMVAVGGARPAIVGYASFGPERIVATAFPSPPSPDDGRPAPAGDLTPGGRAGHVAELYALYVTPAWWSTGTGRALMGSVLAALEAERYRRVVLWVLADNARARRFYERAGFATDGGTNILTGLGGVLELRYTRTF